MTAPRVALDTNVLVSALVFRTGNLAALRTAWQAERIRPMASHETVSELIRVLAYRKFQLTDIEREDLLAEYLPWCESVAVPADIVVPEVRDPDDRMFLRLALSGRADALVTGDDDLLSLTASFPVAIVTPAAITRLLKSA
ncbi:MAG: putative toxin-antitoxin system toxin component, PIN family [Gammaproteobacteria bacterium]|nr:putative toxin-antitoxin system toxin component, PIN family [Gammaproteobacteria bacterium]